MYQFAYSAPPLETLSTGIAALEQSNEAWFIPPHDAPECEHDFGDYTHALQLAQSIDHRKGIRHWADLTGTFIFGDFIEAFFTHFNLHTECLYIDHYVLSQNNIDSLALLLNKGYVDRIEMMISDYWFRNELHGLVPYVYEKLKGAGRFQLGVARTHKKLVLFKTDSGTHICMHGSANLRSSDTDEHLMVEDNAHLYDRLVPRIQAKTRRYRTINEMTLTKLEGETDRQQVSKLARQSRCLTRKETWQVDQESTAN